MTGSAGALCDLLAPGLLGGRRMTHVDTGAIDAMGGDWTRRSPGARRAAASCSPPPAIRPRGWIRVFRSIRCSGHQKCQKCTKSASQRSDSDSVETVRMDGPVRKVRAFYNFYPGRITGSAFIFARWPVDRSPSLCLAPGILQEEVSLENKPWRESVSGGRPTTEPQLVAGCATADCCGGGWV